jgi:hypothetical protein
VKELLPYAPPTFSGVLRISIPTPLAVIGLRGTVNERGDFLITTLSPVPEVADLTDQVLLFPHIVQGGGYTTEFMIFGRVDGASSGQVNFISRDGSPLDLQTSN